MPVVSPVAAAACAPMEIEALPRSPGGEKRRLVPGLETVPCLTVYLFVVVFFHLFLSSVFTKYFLKCTRTLERISTLENGWLFLSSMQVHLLNASVSLQLLSAHCR